VLVSGILLNSSDDASLSSQGTDDELTELLSWLERESMLQLSKAPMGKIAVCASGDDQKELQRLLGVKMEVDRKLQELHRNTTLFGR